MISYSVVPFFFKGITNGVSGKECPPCRVNVKSTSWSVPACNSETEAAILSPGKNLCKKPGALMCGKNNYVPLYAT